MTSIPPLKFFFLSFFALLCPLGGAGQGDGMIKSLQEYVRIPSYSNSEKAAGEYLQELSRKMGLEVTPMGQTNGNFNFAASIRPLADSLPNIIFLNHIDVVPEGELELWNHPPFSGHLENEELWGRGAFDNKGVAIMQLYAVVDILRQYDPADLPYNVTFLAVSCEETQCKGGIQYVVDNYLDKLNPVVVIGEGPPSLNKVLKNNPDARIFGISVAHKRALWLKLELNMETAGHASISPAGYAPKELVEALHRLLKKKRKIHFTKSNVAILKQLGKEEGGIVGFALRNARLFKPLIIPKLRKQPEMYALFSNTITLTNIDSYKERANPSYNVIPQTAVAYLDCRLLPTTSKEKFLKKLRQRLGNEDIKVSIMLDMPSSEPSSTESKFYSHLNSAIKKNNPKAYTAAIIVPNFTDAGVFRERGIPSYSSTPVLLDRTYMEAIHGPNERIPVGILEEGRRVYADFLSLCLEGAR